MPRERKVNGQGQGGHKTGDGIGGGPVGPGSYSGRPGTTSGLGGGNIPEGPSSEKGVVGGSGSGLILAALAWLLLGKKSGGNGSSGGGSSLGKIIRIIILILIVVALFRACSSANSYVPETVYDQPSVSVSDTVPSTAAETATDSSSVVSPVSFSNYTNPYGISTINAANTSNSAGWTHGDNRRQLNTSVAENARNKFYTAKDNQNVTVMVYMIATDLESNYGMATADLQEMIAGLGEKPENMHIIVYGGGCKGWRNNVFSNSSNLVYELNAKGLTKLGEDGDKVMTDPSTLAGFIQFCGRNYPANRNILIFWDHGGGSVTGYGYDERHRSAGSMDLAEIYTALNDGGVKFDFIGFDACLMATAETALVTGNFADYLVASEESEPGIGWYHTNWVKALCQNPQIETIQLGKVIVDDFVNKCATDARGQDATLSVTDLAEFTKTAPAVLDSFSTSTTEIINNDGYASVAKARAGAKEYASSSRIDQVDMTDLAMNLNSDSSRALADCILSAVKYNNTSSTIKDSYGLSVYFPYRNLSTVSSAIRTFDKVNINYKYSRCLESFAAMAASGQAASGGYSNPFGSLSGSSSYADSYSNGSYTAYDSSDLIFALMQSMMGGRNVANVNGLDGNNSEFYGFIAQNGFNTKKAAQYIADHHFDPSLLQWKEDANGNFVIDLPKAQWELVQTVEQNLFIDDGAGFIDYGLDLTTDCFTEDGKLVGDYQGYWLAVNTWECAYYRQSEIVDDEGNNIVTGYIPVLYNGERARLIVTFTNSDVTSVVVQMDYSRDENPSDIAAKTAEIQEGDEIVLIADYYDYDGTYQDTYKISDTLVATADGFDISDVELQDPGSANACYRITDIYNQTYWTPVMR